MTGKNKIGHDMSKLRSPHPAPENKMHWSELVLYTKESGRIYMRSMGCMHDIEQDCLVRMWLIFMEIEGEGAARLIYSFHAPVLEKEETECDIAAAIGTSALNMLLAGTQSKGAKALREKNKNLH